ncbi:MAG: SMP-30/Gluconolaconase/LRE domain protein [Acidimicrobiales bacterium]|nr:SMP-30/Gluconolaconase/LRE domain protein [Acidimicrobiales bacterium]
MLGGLAFGEGPRWHDGALWLSDMHRHRVLRVVGDEVTTVLQHDSPVSGLGWLPDGRLLVVAMAGDVLRLDPEGVVVHADLRALAPHGVNDMISHPGGWSYVGQFGYDRHAGGRLVPSALLRVGPDGQVDAVADDLLVANGMALTADGSTLLVAESAGNRIRSFAVGDHGDLSGGTVWAELPPGHAPDGMCLDAEGAVWVAAVTAGAFLRVRAGGEVADRIPVDDGRRAIACVLGGHDRQMLYLLTATTLGDAEPSLAAMDARVDTVQVVVPGEGRP